MRRLLFSLVPVVFAAAAAAAGLDLPVHYPGDGIRPPCYAGDQIELQLTPQAARLAHPLAAGPTRALRTRALGVAGVDAAAQALGATLEPEFAGETPATGGGIDFTAFHLVRLAAGTPLEDALARFRALPEVASASPVALLRTLAVPNDSLLSREHWLYQSGGPRHDIRAPEAWDAFAGDTSIVVAVLDTGVLPYHPDLGGTVAGGHGNMWVNWAELNGTPGVDDDGNGFADDPGGWDFVDGVSGDPSDDLSVQDSDPNDEAGHGTLVAGIIGAIGNNASGIAGVVPNVRIMPVRVAWLDTGPGSGRPNGTVTMPFAAAGIRYATRTGASVINCSFESASTPGLDSAVTAATRAGVTVVTSSGNSGSPTYLATRPDVISVAATDSTDTFWGFSGLSSDVDLSADGLAITSTYFDPAPTGHLGIRTPTYLSSSGLLGTSFSAPQVSGAVALLQGQARARGRKPLTPVGVLLRLRDTAVDITAANGGTPGFPPRIDLERALTDTPRSLATRARGLSVGAPVVLRYNTGVTRVVYATTDRKILALDGATGDTAWIAAIPTLPSVGSPIDQIAGADMGNGFGVGLFVGTTQGAVLGYRDDGTILPGWPRRLLGGGVAMSGGVALADIDGDGEKDVVCGEDDGNVWAWHADGTLFPGFPFNATAPASAPALADLDGVPGAEIVFEDGNWTVHAIGADANERWSAPGPVNALAPVIDRRGVAGGPQVIVVGQTTLIALDANGTLAWGHPIPANVPVAPALGDIDGDGADDIAIASGSPVSIAWYDSVGGAISPSGWPLTPAAPPIGPLVVGPLAAGGGACVGFWSSQGFVAYDGQAKPVGAFPKHAPGPGNFPVITDLDGDDASEVAAGSGADSSLYVLDAGPGTWNAALASWAEPRGDGARTASRAVPTTPAIIDRIRPAAVTDLTGGSRSTTSLLLMWTVTGDDSLAGRADHVELRASLSPITPANFASGALVATGSPGNPGTLDSALVIGLQEAHLYYFAMRVHDDAGNVSALSNLIAILTPGQAPGTIADLRVTAVNDTVVTLAWTATGDDGNSGRPASYSIAAAPGPLTSAGFDNAPIQLSKAATVDAGGAETATMTGLTRGRQWQFAVIAIDHTSTRGQISNVAVVTIPVGGALSGHYGIAVAARVRPSRLPVTIDWQGATGTPVAGQGLAILDLGGRVRRRVDLGSDPGGSWTWNGRDEENRLVPAGLYFVRLTSGGRSASTRIVLIR
jgi:hypothetical protein